MASGDIGTTHQSALDQFRKELIVARFDPVGSPRRWRGPIPDAFQGLTEARLIEIEFVDGWPFRPPKIFVEGLGTEHVNAAGGSVPMAAGRRIPRMADVPGRAGEARDMVLARPKRVVA